MKFVRFLLKSLMFFIILICTFIACCVVSWTLTIQTKESTTGFVIWSVKDDSVGMNDAIGYWGTTIKANYSTYKKELYEKKEFLISEEGITIQDFDTGEEIKIYTIRADVAGPKFRCRNWLPWTWYKNSVGKGLDYAIDAVAALTSPILLPTMNIKNLEKFYGKQLIDFKDEIAKSKKAAGIHYYEDAIQALYNCADDDDYGKWVDNYPLMYDYMFKIAKYNALDSDGEPIYGKYFNKFVGEDRMMNSSVVLLYYTILIDLIISIWMVTQLSDDYLTQKFGYSSGNGQPNQAKKPGLFKRLFRRRRP